MPTKLTESERHRRVVEAALDRLGSFDPTRAVGLARLATTGRSALSTAAGLARSVWSDLEQELQAATVDWLRMRRLHAVWVAAEKWVALETASARAAKSAPSEVPRFEFTALVPWLSCRGCPGRIVRGGSGATGNERRVGLKQGTGTSVEPPWNSW